MLHGTWDDSIETDVSSQRLIDAQIQKTSAFIENHEESLHRFDKYDDLHCSANASFQKVRIALDPTERVAVQNISLPEDTNEPLKKAMSVLVFLCDEVNELKEIAGEKFIAPLIMFGRLPTESIEGEENLFFGSMRHTTNTACAHLMSLVGNICIVLKKALESALKEKFRTQRLLSTTARICF